MNTIKDKIRDALGFTVNVGIGDCKLLAKMASDFEKPDKASDAINSKFGSATIVRRTSMKSNLNVGKKYQAQIAQKKK